MPKPGTLVVRKIILLTYKTLKEFPKEAVHLLPLTAFVLQLEI
jgi:hypothetical protein